MSESARTTAAAGTMTFRLRPFVPSDLEAIAHAATESALADDLPFAMTPDTFTSEVLRFPGFDPGRDLIVAEVDGHIVGGAWLRSAVRDGEWRHGHEGTVTPEWRGRGIGRALVRAMRKRAAERAADTDDDGLAHRLTCTASDTNARDARLFTSEGYRPVRWFGLMTRALRDPDLPLEPARALDGIDLRPFRPEHHRAAFAALDEAFRDHYGHRPLTEADVERVVAWPGFDPTLWRVAWAGDEIAGVSRNAYDEEETARLGLRQGWIEQIGVRRRWRGRGIASLLLASSMAEFVDRGFDRAILGVDVDNATGAVGLYERLGFVFLSRATEWMRDLEDAPTGDVAR